MEVTNIFREHFLAIVRFNVRAGLLVDIQIKFSIRACVMFSIKHRIRTKFWGRVKTMVPTRSMLRVTLGLRSGLKIECIHINIQVSFKWEYV